MSAVTSTAAKLAVMQVELQHVKSDLAEVKDTVKELRDAFIEGRGGVKTAKFGLRLIWIGMGGVISAIGFKLTDLFHSLPPR